MPGGERAAVLRAGQRARLGSGVPGPGAALWVEAEPVDDEEITDQIRELAAEYKTVVVAILQRRNAWQVIDSVQRITDPSELADLAGYAAYLTGEQKRELLETPDVEARLLARAGLGPRPPGRARGLGEDPDRRPRGHGQAAAGVPAARAARRHPQGAGRGRTRGLRRLPGPRRGRRPAREGPRGRAARGRQAGAGLRPEPRDRLDPHLAGHRARPAVERHHRRQHRHRRRPGDPGRRPPRPRRRQGPHRGVPRGALAPRRARPPGRRRPRLRSGAGARRPARGRQDLAGRVGGALRSAASSSASRSAASGTRPRSAATGVPTSARCPGASCGPSARRAR